jgi:hypothetical protein
MKHKSIVARMQGFSMLKHLDFKGLNKGTTENNWRIVPKSESADRRM